MPTSDNSETVSDVNMKHSFSEKLYGIFLATEWVTAKDPPPLDPPIEFSHIYTKLATLTFLYWFN